MAVSIFNGLGTRSGVVLTGVTTLPATGVGYSAIVINQNYTDDDLGVSIAAVSPVPLPAALLMFGAAIMGVGGIGLAEDAP